MKEDIYVTSLRRGVAFHEGAQALAFALRVPESTLRRWMSGRAMMPEQAFARLLELIVEHEARAPASAPGPRTTLSFRVEDLMARCRKCGATAFSADPSARMVDPLACLACGEEVVHRDLLIELAQRIASRRKERAAGRRNASAPRRLPVRPAGPGAGPEGNPS